MTTQEYISAVNRFRPSVLKYCIYKVEHVQDAEDLTTIIFCNMWINHEHIRFSTIEKYLKRVTWNVYVDYLRHKSAVVDKHPLDGLEVGVAPVDNGLLKEIERVIEALPDQQRRLIRMKYFEDMEPRKISVALGLSDSTIRNQLCTGLKAIRRQVKKSFL